MRNSGMLINTSWLYEPVTVIGLCIVVVIVVAVVRLRKGRLPDPDEKSQAEVAPAKTEPIPQRTKPLRFGRISEVLPSMGEAGPPAWLVLIPDVGVIGPCKSQRQAEGFLRSEHDVQKRYAVAVDIGVVPSICRLRRDLSDPPFYVWEFIGGKGGPLYGVQGPNGWEISLTSDPDIAQTAAAQMKINSENNAQSPTTGWSV